MSILHDVNTADIRGAVLLGCRTMCSVFNADDHDVPFFSSHDVETTQRLVTEAGLQIDSARGETADEEGQPVTFLWIMARKPELISHAE